MRHLNSHDFSSMLHKDESLDEEAEGSIVVVGSTNSSAVGSLDLGGLDAPVEDLNLGRLELAVN